MWCQANPVAAAKLLGWQAQFGIERMCGEHWRWQEKNPHEFKA
jgi:UDP-glucose 4-epimerase